MEGRDSDLSLEGAAGRAVERVPAGNKGQGWLTILWLNQKDRTWRGWEAFRCQGVSEPSCEGLDHRAVVLGDGDHGSVMVVNCQDGNEPSIQIEGELGREGLL